MGRRVDIEPPAVDPTPLAWRYRWLRRRVVLQWLPGGSTERLRSLVWSYLDGSDLTLAERCARLEEALSEEGRLETLERNLQNDWECRQRWQQRRRTDLRGGDPA